MNKYYQILELNSVLQMLRAQTGCADAADAALALTPSSDLAAVEVLLNQTQDAFSLCARFGTPSFSGLQNVNGPLARAAAGGALSAGELLKIAAVLRSFRALCSWRGHCENMTASLTALFDGVTENNYLEGAISKAIVSEEEISDHASDTLFDIRRRIRAKSASVREMLDKMIRSPYYQKYLQEPIVTQRGGRYVVPVKSECRAEVKGLVHDTSASGQTVFVEPAGVVEANNAIKVLEGQERDEISRILYALSAMAGSFADGIRTSYQNAADLDLIFAKARLASQMRAVRPSVNREGITVLKAARHPLIDPKKVVPIDVSLGETFDTLVITGPNTGGKTVTLKTTGLLTAMAMCGLLIPAGDGSRICVYDQILVDIGDEQSIAQNLSTFSSHMKNIISILKTASDNSLVLIDELGAGTDPAEGAALAVAVIEQLRAQGAQVMATTHYPELKAYALNTPGVTNGACEFDVKTLRPTYRLLIGMPGRSNAFVISRRLGLPESVTERAQALVSDENRQFEGVLENLEKERSVLDREKARTEEMYRRAQSAADKAEASRRRSEQQRENEIQAARNEARRIVEDARRKSAAFLLELEKLKKEQNNTSATELARRARREIKNNLGELQELTDPAERVDFDNADYTLPRPLKKGDQVLVRGLGKAEVVETGAKLTVQAGPLKTRVSEKDVRFLGEKPAEKPSAPVSVHRAVSRGDSSVGSTVDLRGMTAEEAVTALQMYLDRAAMTNLNELTVIHGKGTGVLRRAVADELKHNRLVASYRLGRYGEGETGVTIVELK